MSGSTSGYTPQPAVGTARAAGGGTGVVNGTAYLAVCSPGKSHAPAPVLPSQDQECTMSRDRSSREFIELDVLPRRGALRAAALSAGALGMVDRARRQRRISRVRTADRRGDVPCRAQDGYPLSRNGESWPSFSCSRSSAASQLRDLGPQLLNRPPLLTQHPPLLRDHLIPGSARCAPGSRGRQLGHRPP